MEWPSLPTHRSVGLVVSGTSEVNDASAEAIADEDSTFSFFNDDTFKGIAAKHDADVGQVLLSWAVQNDIAVIPKTESEERLKNNLKVGGSIETAPTAGASLTNRSAAEAVT